MGWVLRKTAQASLTDNIHKGGLFVCLSVLKLSWKSVNDRTLFQKSIKVCVFQIINVGVSKKF